MSTNTSNQNWTWTNMGKPASSTAAIVASAGVIEAGGNENVVVLCADNNLWTYYGTGLNLSSWQWGCLGGASELSISGYHGFATAVGTLQAFGPNIFMLDTSGCLWTCYISNGQWIWGQIFLEGDNPDGSVVQSPLQGQASSRVVQGEWPSVLLIQGSERTIVSLNPTTDKGINGSWIQTFNAANSTDTVGVGGVNSAINANFVSLDRSKSRLFTDYIAYSAPLVTNSFPVSDSIISKWWSWESTTLLAPPNDLTIKLPMGSTIAGGNSNAFVICSDNNLWTCYVTENNGWQWGNLYNPGSSITITASMGTLSEGDGSSAFVFGKGSDGNLWACCLINGTWGWANLGTPPSSGSPAVDITIWASLGNTSWSGATALVLGSDGNMWSCQQMLMGA